MIRGTLLVLHSVRSLHSLHRSPSSGRMTSNLIEFWYRNLPSTHSIATCSAQK